MSFNCCSTSDNFEEKSSYSSSSFFEISCCSSKETFNLSTIVITPAIAVVASIAQPTGFEINQTPIAFILAQIDFVNNPNETVAVALAVDIPRVDIICSVCATVTPSKARRFSNSDFVQALFATTSPVVTFIRFNPSNTAFCFSALKPACANVVCNSSD